MRCDCDQSLDLPECDSPFFCNKAGFIIKILRFITVEPRDYQNDWIERGR